MLPRVIISSSSIIHLETWSSIKGCPGNQQRHVWQIHSTGCHDFHAPKPTVTPEAIKQLHKSLSNLFKLYGDLMKDFERESRRVKPYAGSVLMSNLWAAKIRSGEEHHKYPSAQSGSIQDGKEKSQGFRTRVKDYVTSSTKPS